MTILETDRLVLRTLTLDDAEFIYGLVNDPSWLRYIGDRGVRDLDGARRYIADGPMASYAEHGFGLWHTATRADGVAIGICGLLKRETLDDVDIGFAFLPQHWSKGYAIEAASGVMAHARNMLGLTRVVAITSPENASSIRVLEKLGMRFERMVQLDAGGRESKLFATNDHARVAEEGAM